MNKFPFNKIALLNDGGPYDWEFGKSNTNIIIEHKYLNIQLLRYLITTKNGDGLYDTFSIKEPDTNCVVLIRNKENEIGLIKEWRPIPEKWFWECVRGFSDPNDKDSVAVAEREVLEEIGNYGIINSKKIGVLYQNTSYFENPIEVILMQIEKPEEKNKLETGIIDFKFFSLKEIKKMIVKSEIEDQFTISALTKFIFLDEIG